MTYISSGPTLYRAPFVVPVTSAPIADGGVLIHDGLIVAVDRFSRLHRAASRVVDVESAVITPALINCHAHLELSYLADLSKSEADNFSSGAEVPTDFTDWIRKLLVKRGQSISQERVIEAGRKALAAQHQRGVGLVADIGNQPVSKEIGAGGAVEILFFRELLGITEKAAEFVLAGLSSDEQCTAHSPYSCHPFLIRALKERSRRMENFFPIHLAESIDEITFLRTGKGAFHDFLLERLILFAALADGQTLSEVLPHPKCGGVEYLRSLGVLDEQTICVHAVHISEAEVDLLAKARAKVCLCPASNRKLNVGTAPVPLLLKYQILPGLGTDSLASNDCLDLWHEMRVLQEDHPSVSPEQIFAMATVGGASTLGVRSRLGSLTPGQEARLLAIDFSGNLNDIFPFLVSRGIEQKVSWVEGT